MATTDVYSFEGLAVHHSVGIPFSSNGSSTSEFRFGDYSSVVPEYNANGICAEGTYALVANEYFAPGGLWRTRLARVHPPC